MALGFTPLSTSSLGDSPRLKAQASVRGSIQVPVAGLFATAGIGSATSKVRITVAPAGVQAAGALGVLGSVAAGGKMTTYALGLAAQGAVGSTGIGGRGQVAVVSGFGMQGLLGTPAFVGASTVVAAGVAAAGQLGAVTADSSSQWMEVVPSSTPGWQDVDIHMHIPT